MKRTSPPVALISICELPVTWAAMVDRTVRGIQLQNWSGHPTSANKDTVGHEVGGIKYGSFLQSIYPKGFYFPANDEVFPFVHGEWNCVSGFGLVQMNHGSPRGGQSD